MFTMIRPGKLYYNVDPCISRKLYLREWYLTVSPYVPNGYKKMPSVRVPTAHLPIIMYRLNRLKKLRT